MKRNILPKAFLAAAVFSTSVPMTIGIYAQDIHFAQFNQSPLTLNPALAGTTVWIRGVLQYRGQWGWADAYSTIGASFDVKSKKRWLKVKKMTEKYRQPGEDGFGWGINVFNDRAGDGKMGTLQANAALAYQIYLNPQSMLALGFQGGIMQRSINFDKLYWGTQYDPNSSTGWSNNCVGCHADNAIASGDGNFIIPDLNTGLIYTYKKSERYMRGSDQKEFTLGAALFHVTQPKYSFLGSSEKLYQRMVIHGTGTFGIANTSLAISPGFLMARQGPNQEILLGSLFRYMLREDSKYTGYIKGASISAGGYYRNQDAFVAAALFEFGSYGIGISYDINVSGLKTVSYGRGGFEISLRYLNPAPFIYSQASFGK